jgi:ATP-dependent RNA helicase DeaD
MSLADRVQREPLRVEGSVPGTANADIDHVLHIVDPDERAAAIINLLLAHPDDQTLVFVRTRADASELSTFLVRAGFAASGLSGDMEQAARNRALAAFRQGGLRVMVATDVAARGIDVQDVTRVVHAELPRDPDAYTHRSGRTGRAGRKGVSALLVAPSQVVQATRLLRQLGAAHRFAPIPGPEEIYKAQDDRVFAQLTAAEEAESADVERYRALAERLLTAAEPARVLARLLALNQPVARPRTVRAFQPRPERERERPERRERQRPRDQQRGPGGERGAPKRVARGGGEPRGEDFVPFRINWGKQRGADPRRVLALICRRGQIEGRDVGPIRVERNSTTVGVARSVADSFERKASKPDPGEPGVHIRREARAG